MALFRYLSAARHSPQELYEAITSVLNEERYKLRALEMAGEFASVNTRDEVLKLVSELVTSPSSRHS